MKLTHPRKKKNRSPFFVPILLLIFVSLLGGCITSQTKVPQISQDAEGPQLTGKFVWYDVFTDDLSGTATFYSELFGWSFQDLPASKTQVQTIVQDGVPIGNAIAVGKRQNKNSGSQWLSYMSVPDVDEAVQVVEDDHGTIHTAAKQLPDRGRVAVVRDPQGALFALLHSSTGDPKDEDLKYSAWLGSELWTTDMEKARIFYTNIAGYEEKLVPLTCGDTYHFLMRDEEPRAGIAQIPWDDVDPIWIPYVGVESVATITSKAIELGATLIMEPDTAFPENEVAILADPSGAIFGIQQIDINLSPQG
ncbi:VOC family protein [Desulforhopalus sp. 52FAK]